MDLSGQYAPPERPDPHGWAKFGHALAALTPTNRQDYPAANPPEASADTYPPVLPPTNGQPSGPAVDTSLAVSGGRPLSLAPAPAIGSIEDLEARAGQTRAYTPAIPTAPEPGSTEDLEARRAQLHTYPPAIPQLSPAEARLKALTDAGAPPVKPLRGAKSFFDTLGKIVAPNVEERFRFAPQLAYQRNLKEAESEVTGEQFPRTEAAKTDLQEAQAENQRAEAEQRRNPSPNWKNVPGLEGPNGEPVELNEKTGEHRYGNLTGAKPIRQPGATQEQNKLAFQGVVGKLDAAKLPTDPKSIDKSLDSALTQKVITPEEHAAARSYEAANQTPGTNLTVHVAGQEEGNKLAIDKMFEGSEVIAHMPDGKRVQMSYADAKAQGVPPERLVKLNPKEAQDNRDKQASTGATFKSLDTYRSDFKTAAPKLTPNDRDAMRVLASHTQDGHTAGLLGGMIDQLPLAGPLTSYANKLLEGTMTSDQYKQLSPDGKKLVSDYFTAIIANFANMKNIMGSVGRNPMQLQAEINTIPLPFLDWESANNAFENKRSDLKRAHLPSQNFTHRVKNEPYRISME